MKGVGYYAFVFDESFILLTELPELGQEAHRSCRGPSETRVEVALRFITFTISAKEMKG